MGISYHITIYQSWSTALYHHQIWSWRREVIPAIVEEEEANSWRTKQNSPESYCSGFTIWVIHFHGVGPSPYKTKIMLPSCSFQCFICLCPWSLNSGDNTQREVQCSGFYNDYLSVSLIFWSILFGFVYLFLFHPWESILVLISCFVHWKLMFVLYIFWRT